MNEDEMIEKAKKENEKQARNIRIVCALLAIFFISGAIAGGYKIYEYKKFQKAEKECINAVDDKIDYGCCVYCNMKRDMKGSYDYSFGECFCDDGHILIEYKYRIKSE